MDPHSRLVNMVCLRSPVKTDWEAIKWRLISGIRTLKLQRKEQGASENRGFLHKKVKKLKTSYYMLTSYDSITHQQAQINRRKKITLKSSKYCIHSRTLDLLLNKRLLQRLYDQKTLRMKILKKYFARKLLRNLCQFRKVRIFNWSGKVFIYKCFFPLQSLTLSQQIL